MGALRWAVSAAVCAVLSGCLDPVPRRDPPRDRERDSDSDSAQRYEIPLVEAPPAPSMRVAGHEPFPRDPFDIFQYTQDYERNREIGLGESEAERLARQKQEDRRRIRGSGYYVDR